MTRPTAPVRPAQHKVRLWPALIGAPLLAAVVLLWWGLGSPTAGTPDSAQPAKTASPDAAAQPGPSVPTPTASTTPTGADQDLLEAGGEPTWSTPTSSAQASAQAAQDAAWVQRATTFLQAFARPPAGVSAGQWWQRVQPLMSPQAARDYAATDPARVQFTAVTGPGAVVEPDHGVDDEGSVQVGVPTDDGWYLVSLDPTGAVTRIGPMPGSVNLERDAADPGNGRDDRGEAGRGPLGSES